LFKVLDTLFEGLEFGKEETGQGVGVDFDFGDLEGDF